MLYNIIICYISAVLISYCAMRFFKWVLFILLYLLMLVKEYGFDSFVDAFRATNKIVKLFPERKK